jgi:hypothetical protein
LFGLQRKVMFIRLFVGLLELIDSGLGDGGSGALVIALSEGMLV